MNVLTDMPAPNQITKDECVLAWQAAFRALNLTPTGWVTEFMRYAPEKYNKSLPFGASGDTVKRLLVAKPGQRMAVPRPEARAAFKEVLEAYLEANRSGFTNAQYQTAIQNLHHAIALSEAYHSKSPTLTQHRAVPNDSDIVGVKVKSTGKAKGPKAEKLSQGIFDYAFKSGKLFEYDGGCVEAVRLFGDSHTVVPVTSLNLSYDPTAFEVLPEFQASCLEAIEAAKLRAEQGNKLFFNGPNARLVSFAIQVPNDDNCGREDVSVRLNLSPVAYFDSIGLNAALRQRVKDMSLEEYDYLTGLKAIVSSGDITKSKLTNILDIACTIVTSDGWLGYNVRAGGVVESGKKTSAIAENINRFKDDSTRYDYQDLYNRIEIEESQSQKVSSTYESMGIPHPVAACKRGFHEEVSPGLFRRHVGVFHPLITGISFDLYSGHPDLLMMYLVDCDIDEAKQLLRTSRGTDRTHEGEVHFARHEFCTDTLGLLKSGGWLPGGQASFLRAMEVLNELKEDHNGRFEAVFKRLRAKAS